jgi:hypothetical protein
MVHLAQSFVRYLLKSAANRPLSIKDCQILRYWPLLDNFGTAWIRFV